MVRGRTLSRPRGLNHANSFEKLSQHIMSVMAVFHAFLSILPPRSRDLAIESKFLSLSLAGVATLRFYTARSFFHLLVQVLFV